MNSEILKEEIREETIRWLDSLKKTIRKPQHQALWHYAEAIDTAIKTLSTETKTKCVAQIKVDTEEIVRRIKEEYDITDRWIPCSERLPSEDGRYLVTYPLLRWQNNWINLMYYGKPSMPNCEVKGKCFYVSDDEWGDVVYDNIIAWMPLPKPYKGNEEE